MLKDQIEFIRKSYFFLFILSNTDADVELASKGNKPPHALHNISAI